MPKKMADLTGQKFGRLTVLSFYERRDERGANYYWNCRCDCGNEVVRVRSSLMGGKYVSCGCWYAETLKKYNEYKIEGDLGIVYINEEEFYFDAEDYDLIKDICWCSKERYAMGRLKKEKRMLHRMVVGCPDGMVVDHINGKINDNRKSNLRICTQADNSRNIRKNKSDKSASKYIGVHKSGKAWSASIGYKRKTIYIGSYKNEIEAALAYNKKAEELGFLTRNIIE